MPMNAIFEACNKSNSKPTNLLQSLNNLGGNSYIQYLLLTITLRYTKEKISKILNIS